MTSRGYDTCVFLNCPFDREYHDIFLAILFAVHDSGFVPRCALQEVTSGKPRLERLYTLMRDCRLAVHDLSRIELDPRTRLPRFNMPLELGIFLGAKRFGDKRQQKKDFLAFDKKKHNYDRICSDLSGLDFKHHGDQPRKALEAVRDWLQSHKTQIHKKEWSSPASEMWERYLLFRDYLSIVAPSYNKKVQDLPYVDLQRILILWLDENPPQRFSPPNP